MEILWKRTVSAEYPQNFHTKKLMKFRYFMQWEKRMTMRFQHCVKSVQIRSFFWSVFSCIQTEYGDLLSKYLYSVRTHENTNHKKLHTSTFFTQCKLKNIWQLKAISVAQTVQYPQSMKESVSQPNRESTHLISPLIQYPWVKMYEIKTR